MLQTLGRTLLAAAVIGAVGALWQWQTIGWYG